MRNADTFVSAFFFIFYLLANLCYFFNKILAFSKKYDIIQLKVSQMGQMEVILWKYRHFF